MTKFVEGYVDTGLDHRISNGALGKLDTLFLTFDQVGEVGDVPILKKHGTAEASFTRHYSVSARFQERVIAAGLQAGRALFVSGDPAFREFYDARESGKAIELLLNPPPGVNPVEWGRRIGWTEAARSVIDRKNIGASVLAGHGEDILHGDSSRRLNLLSIASGWGRLPLDTMDTLDKVAAGNIRAVFIDTNKDAVDGSVKEAEARGLRERVTAEQVEFFDFFRLLGTLGSKDKYDLIESTGFSDYLKDSLLRRLLKGCKALVSDDGVVVITNIISNREKEYLRIVWEQDALEMHRRSPEQLAFMAQAAGLEPKALVLDSTATMCTLVAVPLKDK